MPKYCDASSLETEGFCLLYTNENETTAVSEASKSLDYRKKAPERATGQEACLLDDVPRFFCCSCHLFHGRLLSWLACRLAVQSTTGWTLHRCSVCCYRRCYPPVFKDTAALGVTTAAKQQLPAVTWNSASKEKLSQRTWRSSLATISACFWQIGITACSFSRNWLVGYKMHLLV